MTVCPACGEPAPAETAWCEACGADLHAAVPDPCVACGDLEISTDGYCMACGHKQPAERDHKEFSSQGPSVGGVPGGLAVAVTDRGVRHHHNEDAVAVRGLENGAAVLVVCDGVSSTPGSAEASLRAARAARDVLAERVDAEESGVPTVSDVSEWLLAAASIAQDEAAAAPEVAVSAPHETASPPSSTFVAALGLPGGVSDGPVGDAGPPGASAVAVAWLGDSRAYWLPAADQEAAIQLTHDHEIGGSLSRWIGADAPEGPVDVVIHDIDQSGCLVVCSDGLWRYADSPQEMWALVAKLHGNDVHSADALLALAAALTDHAKQAGGHDNISIALWLASGSTENTTEPIASSESQEQHA